MDNHLNSTPPVAAPEKRQNASTPIEASPDCAADTKKSLLAESIKSKMKAYEPDDADREYVDLERSLPCQP